ncbi:MAG: MBL fold metallo-hydrolase [Anaerolineae bacterium]|nr:MBL fold metallo-hydrolase [Anaerolineae bacterium]MDW8101744.1 MBL fold metallo-hydrolase [Anaerolineae bacterium]
MLIVKSVGPVKAFKMGRDILPGRAFYFTSAYLVDGLLIDAGNPHQRGEFLKALENTPIHTLVNTHSHEDHIGANSLLEKRGIAIKAHREALPILRNPSLLGMTFYRRFFWGIPEPSEASPVGEKVETEKYSFLIIETPGHSPDHIALYEPSEGWLFSGDAYVGGKDLAYRKVYRPKLIMESLRKLASLEISYLFPGSGTVHQNGREKILAKLESLEELKERILELHQRGFPSSVIARKIVGHEPAITWLTFGDFSALNLVECFLRDFA